MAQLTENIRYETAVITESACRAVLGNFAVCLNECGDRLVDII